MQAFMRSRDKGVVHGAVGLCTCCSISNQSRSPEALTVKNRQATPSNSATRGESPKRVRKKIYIHAKDTPRSHNKRLSRVETQRQHWNDVIII